MVENLCPHCGQEHRQGARFCPSTGKLLPENVSSALPTPVNPPPVSGAPGLFDPSRPEAQAGLTGRLPPNAFLRERYLIMRKVGQGGMAAVYQAVDTSRPGVVWAIKEMSDAALANAQDRSYAIQAFEQEANLLRALNHPNLPTVVDFFTEGGKHYLVMEFVPGQTLQSVLEGHTQPFTEADVLPWAIQLCDVLQYLHNQTPKIIFRDLKPSNIMITPQGQIKLIDFGIVRFFKPGKVKDTVALGTPGYVAQEALGGQTDERSDLYSLCVTLHQLLTLNDPLKTMFNLPPVRKLNPQVSVQLERILDRGLQNQRGQRWQSAQELHGEFSRLQTGYPSLPHSPEIVAPGLPRTIAASAAAPVPPQPYSVPAPSAPPVEREYLPTQAVSAPEPAPAIPQHTSRPTMRLVMAATQLTGKQLAFIGAGIVLALVIMAWLLTPVLDESSFNWNNIPVIALFGALGYAAYPKRGIAFASHGILSSILTATIWARLGNSQGYSWLDLILAVLVSGAFMEGWLYFLPKVRGDRGSEAWPREMAWLAGMEVIGTALFMGIVTGWITGFNPVQWLVSAVLGAIGWFVGDTLQQYLLYKKTGLSRFIGS